MLELAYTSAVCRLEACSACSDWLCVSTGTGSIEEKLEQLETQQAKFQQDISATLQAILVASQMTDSERAGASKIAEEVVEEQLHEPEHESTDSDVS